MFTRVHTYDCANAVVTQSFSTGHPWRARPLLVLPFSPPAERFSRCSWSSRLVGVWPEQVPAKLC